MNFKKLTMNCFISVACFTGAAQANEVQLTVNKPMNVTYRVAYQDQGSQPVLGELQSAQIDKDLIIPINLSNHMVAGLVVASVDGHVLPDTANQFNQPNQCSITTDSEKTSGKLAISLEKKQINCKYTGGIFG